jgi:hypothetical protein
METYRNIKPVFYFFFFVTIILTSCKVKEPQAVLPIPANAILVKVIDASELDGCQMLLEMESGDKLDPINLPEKYKKDGIRLFITYKIKDGVSICMSGKLVQLDYISEAK